MLEIKGINQYYGGSHILRDVSLQAELGKVTVILGRNGVGVAEIRGIEKLMFGKGTNDRDDLVQNGVFTLFTSATPDA